MAIKPIGRTSLGGQERMEVGDGASFPAQIGEEVWIAWHGEWRRMQPQRRGKVGCRVRDHGPQARKVKPSEPLLVQTKPFIRPPVAAWGAQHPIAGGGPADTEDRAALHSQERIVWHEPDVSTRHEGSAGEIGRIIVIAADDPERVALLCQDSIEGQELGLFLCPQAKAHAKVTNLDELLLCDPVDAQLAGEGVPLSVHITDHNHDRTPCPDIHACALAAAVRYNRSR